MKDEVSTNSVEQVEPTVANVPAKEVRWQKGEIRKYFLYVLTGGVALSAVISVIAILAGGINDYVGRALLTTLSMVVHAVIALAIMSAANKQQSRADEFLTNTIFAVVIASFFTTALGIWEVLSGELTGDLYQLYFYTIIASLVIRLIQGARAFDVVSRRLQQTAIGIAAFLWLYLIPSVFQNGYYSLLPDMYYRGIAAVSVLLGTSIILFAIFRHLYAVKHPEQRAAGAKPGDMPVWLIVILCIIGAPLATMIFFSVVGLLFAGF